MKRRIGLGHALALLLIPASTVPCPGADTGPDPRRVEEAFQRAAACLSKDLDGAGFRDPYLSYVYPAEDLPVPPGSPRLTYRTVDAYAVLVLLGRGGRVPDVLAPAVRRADEALRGVVPVWRDRGIYNLRRGGRPGGVALDTFCFVGWLYQDRAMATLAAESLEEDGWLPDGLYGGDERFRRDADEAWCLRLMASPAGPGLGAASAVLDRMAATLREAMRTDPEGRGTFYEAYHLAMVLAEAAASKSPVPYRYKALESEVLSAFSSWAAPLGAAPAARRAAVREWANLASADLPDGRKSRALRARAVEVLIEGQDEDGCFRVPGGSPAGRGSSFLTLRALLGLARTRPLEAGSARAGRHTGSFPVRPSLPGPPAVQP